MEPSIVSWSRHPRGGEGYRHRRLCDVFRLQRTLASQVVLEGVGFWTGQSVRVELTPAPPNTGLVFVRADLPDEPRIPALWLYRDAAKPRQTSLVLGDARVDMVEHILAALRGMGVDNCAIRVSAAEMPGLNGSSQPIVDAIDRGTRIISQPEVQPVRMIIQSLRVSDDDAWIDVTPSRSGTMSLAYHLEYPDGHPIGTQSFRCDLSNATFRRDLATCRTFITELEADQLRAQGIGTHVTPHDLIMFGAAGPVDNHLHFEDECARHKVLDMVGDFALAGCDWIGSFAAYRSGHLLNVECVRQLISTSLLLDSNCLPSYDDIAGFNLRQPRAA